MTAKNPMPGAGTPKHENICDTRYCEDQVQGRNDKRDGFIFVLNKEHPHQVLCLGQEWRRGLRRLLLCFQKDYK